MFSWNVIGELVQIDEIMNVDKYIDEKLVFQQHNDPTHTAQKTINCFKDSNIQLLEWSAQNPDLNPIENLWNLLDAKVPLDQRNKIDFFKNMQSVFENISKDYIENLITNIPRRLEDIILAKDGNMILLHMSTYFCHLINY